MGARDSKPSCSAWILRGPTAIREANEIVRLYSLEVGLVPDDQAKLSIVVEELMANLYDHGGVSSHDEVELTLSVGSRGIHLVLVDPGSPFDARKLLPRQRHATSGAGVGRDLVRSWTEFVDYRVEADRNRLELNFPFAMGAVRSVRGPASR